MTQAERQKYIDDFLWLAYMIDHTDDPDELEELEAAMCEGNA